MDPAARWRPQLSDDGDVAIKLEEEEESLLDLSEGASKIRNIGTTRGTWLFTREVC